MKGYDKKHYGNKQDAYKNNSGYEKLNHKNSQGRGSNMSYSELQKKVRNL